MCMCQSSQSTPTLQTQSDPILAALDQRGRSVPSHLPALAWPPDQVRRSPLGKCNLGSTRGASLIGGVKFTSFIGSDFFFSRPLAGGWP